MRLGKRTFTAGNRIRFTVDYDNWLEPGESLTGGTVALAAEFTATVTDITIEVPAINASRELVFYMEGGSVEEVFTLEVQVTTNRDETKVDTIDFVVVAP